MEGFEELGLAIVAEYLSESQELKVILDDKSKHLWPINRLQMETWIGSRFVPLAKSSDADLSDVQIWGGGTSVYWKTLGQVFEIDELLAGVYGSPEWMESLMLKV